MATPSVGQMIRWRIPPFPRKFNVWEPRAKRCPKAMVEGVWGEET